jgi:tryptophanyl-tRNA synthetase
MTPELAGNKKRILSGMRPTGKLHLGHMVGALENWVALQHEYQNYHLVADWHVLTTEYQHTEEIWPNTIEMVIDWLSGGINPEISPIFVQSKIKEHAELHLLFSMITTLARLERNPAVKEQAKTLGLEKVISYGHVGYPVLQAADILLYKGDFVPVGEDQVPHVEITREIARRFNTLYGNVFPEPQAKLTQFARLPGLDRQRMSKSIGNTILMSDSSQEVWEKLRGAITDELKVRKGDPGRPEVCLVFTYHKKFNPGDIEEIERDCRSGALGCVDCKKRAHTRIMEYLAPIHQKRAYYESHRHDVIAIIEDGNRRAQEIASATMAEVHQVMKFG